MLFPGMEGRYWIAMRISSGSECTPSFDFRQAQPEIDRERLGERQLQLAHWRAVGLRASMKAMAEASSVAEHRERHLDGLLIAIAEIPVGRSPAHVAIARSAGACSSPIARATA